MNYIKCLPCRIRWIVVDNYPEYVQETCYQFEEKIGKSYPQAWNINFIFPSIIISVFLFNLYLSLLTTPICNTAEFELYISVKAIRIIFKTRRRTRVTKVGVRRPAPVI